MPITVAGLRHIANKIPPGPVPDTVRLPFDAVSVTLIDGGVVWELLHLGKVMTSKTMHFRLEVGDSATLSGIDGFSTVSIKVEG